MRRDHWRLALNLSVSAFVAGVLFTLLRAWLVAAITFTGGLLFAVIAAALLRHQNDPTASRPTSIARRHNGADLR